MNTLTIIPARGGSKRFPGKNKYLLCGIPLIAHSILYAIHNKSNYVVVSTDDSELAEIALQYGAQVCMRPVELSEDTSPTIDALHYTYATLKQKMDNIDAIVTLQPTNPLRPQYLWSEALSKLNHSNDSVMSVTLNHLKFGKIDKNGLFVPQSYTPGQRTQDLDKLYFENGLFYASKPELIEQKELFGPRIQTIITDASFAVDIDYNEDLLYAEQLINTYPERYNYYL